MKIDLRDKRLINLEYEVKRRCDVYNKRFSYVIPYSKDQFKLIILYDGGNFSLELSLDEIGNRDLHKLSYDIVMWVFYRLGEAEAYTEKGKEEWKID